MNYNTALAGFQFAKGTIMEYNNVNIAEGALPQCVQVRAVEHIRERQKGLELRQRPDPAVYDAAAQGNCTVPTNVPQSLVGVAVMQPVPPLDGAAPPAPGTPQPANPGYTPLIPSTPAPGAPPPPRADSARGTALGRGRVTANESAAAARNGNRAGPAGADQQTVMTRLFIYEWCCSGAAREDSSRAAPLGEGLGHVGRRRRGRPASRGRSDHPRCRPANRSRDHRRRRGINQCGRDLDG